MEELLNQEAILEEANQLGIRKEVKQDGYILWVAMLGNMKLSECYGAVFLEKSNQL